MKLEVLNEVQKVLVSELVKIALASIQKYFDLK